MSNLDIRTVRGNIQIDADTHLKHMIGMYSTLQTATQQYYPTTGLSYCDVPQIVGITGACENVDTLFKIGNHRAIPLFFSQTGQLMLEFALKYYPGVFTTIHSGRDEGEEDARHLLEFLLAEEEFSWNMLEGTTPYDEDKMFEHLLERIERAVRAMGLAILNIHETTLSTVYGRDTAAVQAALTLPFLRIAYTDAVTVLQQHGYPSLQWGDDLKAEHEAMIVKAVSERARQEAGKSDLPDRPVFIMKYPKDIKFFNMKVWTKDPRVVLSADLCLPISGESVGSAVREHDGLKLKDRLLGSTMFRLHKERGGVYEDFTWYVEDMIIAGHTPPHAGYGLGTSRLIQWMCGMPDIRQCSLFSLMSAYTGDFAPSRHGRVRMVSAAQRTILLSLSDTAKPILMPAIKELMGRDLIFYATSHTHEYLAQNGIETTLVHKINATGQHPNLERLIPENVFDIIINIPSGKNESTGEKTDGDVIRQQAIDSGVYLVTDLVAAERLLKNLAVKIKKV